MTVLDPSGFDPDDERLSRYVDNDLDDGARVALLETELRRDQHLRTKLAEIELAAAWLRESVVDPAPAGLEGALDRALAAFDSRVRANAPHGDPDTRHDLVEADTDPVVDTDTDNTDTDDTDTDDTDRSGVVAPLRPRRSRYWSTPTALGLSAAAALVAIVAVGALLSRQGGDGQADSATAMAVSSTAFDAQRRDPTGTAAPESAEAQASANAKSDPAGAAGDAASSAATAVASAGVAGGNQPLSGEGAALGSFDDVGGLLDAITARGTAPPSSVASSTAPSPTGRGSEDAAVADAPTTTTAAETLAQQAGYASSPPGCFDGLNGTAEVAGRRVRWGVRGTGSSDDPDLIVVLDAEDCSLVGERPV